MIRITALAAAALFTPLVASAQEVCPPVANGTRVFAGGEIGMTTPLAVNPDGAALSYTAGDHGYTYISNGVNLWENGRSVSCSATANVARCRRAWREAERLDFAPGSPEFCAFAMEVAPPASGGATQSCGGWRRIVGNGKGRPAPGPVVTTVTGASLQTYVSTTSIRHMQGGAPRYLDSSALPVLVVPQARADLLGAVAWVRYRGRTTFAIVGETGPRFGEGSVALHRLLRTGSVGVPQAPGPISHEARCGPAEQALAPPFQSRPDLSQDRCRSGYAARGPSDIRAYTGIEGGVETVVLPNVRVPRQGNVATGTISVESLEGLARTAGYSNDRLQTLADCLS